MTGKLVIAMHLQDAAAFFDGDTTMRINLKLLGLFEVTVNGTRIPDTAWKLRHPRQLLQILATRPGLKVNRDQLIEFLWPKLDQHAANNRLYHTIHTLRKIFQRCDAPESAPIVLLQAGELSLNPVHCITVDSVEHLSIISKARSENDKSRVQKLLEQAIKNYQGDLLANNLYEDWLGQHREECKLSFIWALDELARITHLHGNPHNSIALYQKLVDVEPVNELAHRKLMELYVTTQHPERALQQYSICRRYLQRDLDVEPTPETTALAKRIAIAFKKKPVPADSHAQSSHSVGNLLLRAPTNLVGHAIDFISLETVNTEKSKPLFSNIQNARNSNKIDTLFEQCQDHLSDGALVIQLSSLYNAKEFLAHLASALTPPHDSEVSDNLAVQTSAVEKTTLLVLDRFDDLLKVTQH
jgi:DNA-binding SARP family transcriptional activator